MINRRPSTADRIIIRCIGVKMRFTRRTNVMYVHKINVVSLNFTNCDFSGKKKTKKQGNMDSIMVPNNPMPRSQLRFNVTVSDPTKNYQFAISANSRHLLVNDPYNGNQFTSISGGMVWESCEIRRNTRRGNCTWTEIAIRRSVRIHH